MRIHMIRTEKKGKWYTKKVQNNCVKTLTVKIILTIKTGGIHVDYVQVQFIIFLSFKEIVV